MRYSLAQFQQSSAASGLSYFADKTCSGTNKSEETVITYTGTFNVSQSQLEQMFARLLTPSSALLVKNPHKEESPPKIAFILKEIAEVLGRGLLKSPSALHCKIISKIEIEGFLK